MTDKKSFILYHDMWWQLSHLTDEELGQVTRAIFVYSQEWQIIELPRMLKIVFEGIRCSIDRSSNQWTKERIKRAEAGRLWGLAKASNAKHSLANLADSVSVSVSVSDTVSNNSKDDVYMQAWHLSITHDEFSKLEKEFWAEKSDQTVQAILNYRKNTKYKSLYLTAIKWMRDENKKKEEPVRKVQLTTKYEL